MLKQNLGNWFILVTINNVSGMVYNIDHIFLGRQSDIRTDDSFQTDGIVTVYSTMNIFGDLTTSGLHSTFLEIFFVAAIAVRSSFFSIRAQSSTSGVTKYQLS
jgi:hypothetical protein